MIIRRTTNQSGTLCFLLVVSFMLPLSSVLFTATEVVAVNRYVKPSTEVVIRSGEGTEYRVIGMVKDGNVVDLVEESESYALVRLADGKEGWMLKRFLSVEPPLTVLVASLRAENEKLKQKETELARHLEEVSASLKRAETGLQPIVAERDKIKTEYQNLQTDTADVIKIKEDMLEATKENESLVREMASIKEENNNLSKGTSINWFLAGGGVLLVGMTIGRLSGKSRKKKSSLM